MNLSSLGRPAASASLHGADDYAGIFGTVSFFPRRGCVLVSAEIWGLPHTDDCCTSRIFGFHIHEGDVCDPPDFASTGGHYNPNDCLHPYHAGDLPPLFSCHGHAFSAFLTERFSIPEVLGRTVVIHSDPDDFHTQPSGHSGAKVACGVIRSTGICC